jgi:3-hydroxybutyrate dehydrogenase
MSAGLPDQEQDMRLEGRHAFVTGGSRGIGRAIAAMLTRAGAIVTITGRGAEALLSAVEAGVAAHGLVADVTDEAALAEAIVKASSWGSIDILVNNAGTAETGPFVKQGRDVTQRMIDQHLHAPMLATRLVLPGMMERRFGRIINIASILSLKGQSHLTAYGAAKHAMLGFTRSLAVEVARSGVTVNAICPGYTVTDLVVGGMTKRAQKTGKSVEEELATLAGPIGRLVTPDEVASACLWLASDAASGVTGQAIVVDGGDTVS